MRSRSTSKTTSGSPRTTSRIKMSNLQARPVLDDYKSDEEEQTKPDFEQPSPKMWLAITALIFAILALAASIVFAFIIIPNQECDCPCENTSNTESAALTTDANSR